MRRIVWVILVVAACTPLVLVALLFAAARWTRMDGMTLGMPDGFRKPVAALAMNNAGYGADSLPKIDRVMRLDPENATAWSRRCAYRNNDDAALALSRCEKALSLDRSEVNLNGVGEAQERLKNYCAAEDTFTRANSMVNARDEYILRNLGRAALECGHVGAAISSFEVAEEHDAKDAEDDGDDLMLDREWLVIAYKANHDPKGASGACAKAHPDWKGCDCAMDGNAVKCDGTK